MVTASEASLIVAMSAKGCYIGIEVASEAPQVCIDNRAMHDVHLFPTAPAEVSRTAACCWPRPVAKAGRMIGAQINRPTSCSGVMRQGKARP